MLLSPPLPSSRAADGAAAATPSRLPIRAYTALRLVFGIVLTIDAVLKWLPGFRSSYVSQLRDTAQGQPGFLHGWFHFWITLSAHAPNLFVDLTALAETTLAVVLVLGIARRAGYLFGAVYMLGVWAIGEGFGGPYSSGATDIGAGIIYTLLFLVLYVASPSAAAEPLCADRTLVRRFPAWRIVAEPHPSDRSR